MKVPISKIVHGNNLKVMKEIRSDCIDLILTDPPYMVSSKIKITRGRKGMKFKGKDLEFYFGKWDEFDSVNVFMEWIFIRIDEMVRLLRKGGMLCCYFNYDIINFLSRYLQGKHGFKLKGYYADCKSNPVPQAMKVGWMSGWEIIGMWQKPGGKLTYNYQLGQQTNYSMRPIHATKEDGDRVHPTQKPIKLARTFVVYWTNRGDVVFDPFAGSGWACIAAKKEGRQFCGIEKSLKYCKIARKKLEGTRPSLFGDQPKKERKSFGLENVK